MKDGKAINNSSQEALTEEAREMMRQGKLNPDSGLALISAASEKEGSRSDQAEA